MSAFWFESELFASLFTATMFIAVGPVEFLAIDRDLIFLPHDKGPVTQLLPDRLIALRHVKSLHKHVLDCPSEDLPLLFPFVSMRFKQVVIRRECWEERQLNFLMTAGSHSCAQDQECNGKRLNAFKSRRHHFVFILKEARDDCFQTDKSTSLELRDRGPVRRSTFSMENDWPIG